MRNIMMEWRENRNGPLRKATRWSFSLDTRRLGLESIQACLGEYGYYLRI